MLAALIVGALGQAALDQKVSYESKAKDVSLILADLQKQTSVPFLARGLKDWPLIVSVKDMPLRRLMDKIAEVTDATWEKEGEKQILVRTDTRRREAEKVEAGLRGKRIVAFLNAVHKPELLAKWTDDEIKKRLEADMTRIASQIREMRAHNQEVRFARYPDAFTPARQLLDHILLKTKPEWLGGIPVYGIQTFSNVPGPGVAPLPINIGEALGVYKFNRVRTAEIVGSGPKMIEGLSVSTNHDLLASPSSGNLRVDLVLSRLSGASNIYAELYVSDQGVIDKTALSIGLVPEAAPELPLSTTGQVQLTETSAAMLAQVGKEYRGMLSLGAEGVGPVYWPTSLHPMPRGRLLSLFQNPAQHEPMGFFATEFIEATAKDLQADVVAYLPDNALGPLHRALSTTRKLTDIWKLQGGPGLEARIEQGCLIVKPTAFARADRYRVNRKALQELLTKASPDSLPSLEDIFRYAEQVPSAHYDANVDALWINAIDPNQKLFAPLVGADRRAMCRFLATLPYARFTEQNFDIDIANMTPIQKGRLLEWIAPSYYRNIHYQGGHFSPVEIRTGNPAVPKVVLPVALAASKRRQAGIYASNPSGICLPMEAVELGMRRGIIPGNLVNIDSTNDFNVFRTYTAESLVFMIQASESRNEYSELRNLRGFKDLSPKLTFNELPEAMKAVIDETAPKAKNIRASMGTTYGSPPPR